MYLTVTSFLKRKRKGFSRLVWLFIGLWINKSVISKKKRFPNKKKFLSPRSFGKNFPLVATISVWNCYNWEVSLNHFSLSPLLTSYWENFPIGNKSSQYRLYALFYLMLKPKKKQLFPGEKTADLIFSKKQCNFGILISRQPWRLV